jgi:hypothetical protein
MVGSLCIVKPSRLGYLLLAVVFLSSSHYNGRVAAEKDENLVVAGYLPEYRFYINLNNTAKHLTDLILFSMTPNDEGEVGTCCLDSHHFEQARQTRANKQENFPGTVPVTFSRF